MQVVVRALSVLAHLANHPEGQTLQELADGLQLPVATAHRLLAVLGAEEYVVRAGEGKRYKLGASALALSRGIRRNSEAAEPYMQALSDQTQETVFLAELVGTRVVCVALVEGTRPLRLFVRVGQEMPVHAAASARSLLAFQPDGLVDAVLAEHELTRFTPETPASMAAVKRHLMLVRERGYDLCDQELDPNVVAVSAPVRAGDGKVTASVTLAAPRDRIDSVTRKRHIALIQRTASSISAAVGFVDSALDR